MSASDGPKIITDGLVFAVDAADKNSYPGSGTTWSDLAGSNVGTLTNGPTFDPGNGGSFDFDGTDDIAESSIDPSVFSTGYDAYTISYWLKYDSLGGYPTVFELRLGTSNNNQWTDYINGNRLYAYPGSAVQLSNSSLSVDTWYNLCVTISQGSGNVFSTYINGELDKTGSWNKNHGTPTKYRIAGNNASRRFNGRISIISYYNLTLSASEVLQNYNALKGRFNL